MSPGAELHGIISNQPIDNYAEKETIQGQQKHLRATAFAGYRLCRQRLSSNIRVNIQTPMKLHRHATNVSNSVKHYLGKSWGKGPQRPRQGQHHSRN